MSDLYRRSGSETPVNTTFTGVQSAPAITLLTNGNYVVVWRDDAGTDARGQVFSEAGAKVGSEFLLHSAGTGTELAPKVGALSGGGFVAVWGDTQGDAGSSATGIHGQRFDATGTVVGSEFQVNTVTVDGAQTNPSVTGLENDRFVITWTDPASSNEIKAAIFAANGTPEVAEIAVTSATPAQNNSTVTMLDDGGFVIAWTNGNSILARSYASNGTPDGAVFTVSTSSTVIQIQPSITALAGGGFVVTWSDQTTNVAPLGNEIRARIYDADNLPVGNDFVVNGRTVINQLTPSVAALTTGGFVIAWEDQSGQEGETNDNGSRGIKAQVFSATGVPEGAEFLVNTTVAQNQVTPVVTALANGGFAVSWQDFGGLDGNGAGIITQTYEPFDAPITDLLASTTTLSETPLQNNPVATLTGVGAVNASFTYSLIADTTGGAFEIRGNQLFARNIPLLDFETAPSPQVTVRVTDQNGHSYDEVLTLTLTDATIERPMLASEDILVNTVTAGLQTQAEIAALDNGGFVVVWTDQSVAGGDIKAQRFDADGDKVGVEFKVNTTDGAAAPTNAQTGANVAGLQDGGFIVTWSHFVSNSSDVAHELRGQFYNADGSARGSEFLIGTPVNGGSALSVIAVTDNGDVVISWRSGIVNTPPGTGDVFARIYAPDGTEVEPTFAIANPTGNQGGQTIVATDDGGFVVAWADDVSPGTIKMRFYDSAYDPRTAEIQVNTATADIQNTPVITRLSNGNYVVTWSTQVRNPALNYDVHHRIFDGDGNAVTVELSTNLVSSTIQNDSRVVALDDGEFVIFWTDNSSSGPANVVGQRFGADGLRIGESFLASQEVLYAQNSSGVASLGGDRFVYLWGDSSGVGGDLSNGALKVRIFDSAANEPPVLTGLATTLTVTEGDAPTPIDADVTFTDADDNFSGGTLAVSGVLAEDVVSITDTGTAPGEIGLSGANVTYGGITIGSFTGGAGADLEVTFNAAATSAAIEALVENLTYASATEAPTAARTLSVTVTDAVNVSTSQDIVVSVSAVDDAPTVTLETTYAPDGGETRVNTTTAGEQLIASVAPLSDGGYVVTWQGNGSGDDAGIFSQRFDAAGAPVGGETRVNTTTVGEQSEPSIAALTDGGYIVTWQGGAGVNTEIFAQRFDASGAASGTEFQVNASISGLQVEPSVAALADGGWIVAWTYTGTNNVLTQRYDASGTPVGGETLSSSGQESPVVLGLADGGYALAVVANLPLGTSSITLWRFAADGSTAWAQEVNPTDSAGNPSLAELADGRLVVTNGGLGPADDGDVFVQLVSADGATVSSAANLTLAFGGNQGAPVVATLSDGDFVVGWYGSGPDGYGVYAWRFDESGSPLGDVFLVNADTFGTDLAPSVAALVDGFVAAWNGDGPGDGAGVYSQRFVDSYIATEQVPLDLKGTIHVADLDTTGDVTVTLTVDSGTLHIEAGTSGVDVDDSLPDEVILTGTIAEIQALLGSDPTSVVTYTADTDSPPPSDTLTVTIDDGTASVSETETIVITPVNDAPDIDLDDIEPGNDAVATWTEGDAPVLLAPYPLFDDDNDDHDGATLTIAVAGATSGDQLSLVDGGAGPDEFGFSGSNVTYEGEVVGTWSGGANGNPLVITFNEDACPCSIERALGSVRYASTDDLTAPGTRTIEFTFVDGDGTANGGSDTATASVEVEVLPAPQIVPGAAVSAAEDSFFIPLNGVVIDIVLDDPASEVITVRLSVDHGTLDLYTGVPGGLAIGDVDGNGTGFLVLTGTQDAINASLSSPNALVYYVEPDFAGTDALAIQATTSTTAGTVAFTLIGGEMAGAPIPRIAMRDIDGDGTSELVVGVEDRLIVFGSTNAFHPLPEAGFATGFAFGDFDGDGIEDIALAVAAGAGDGYVAFLSSVTGDVVGIADVPYALDIVTGDFDGDGRADLAVSDGNNGTVGVLLQDGLGGFEPISFTTPTTSQVGFLAVGDFDGDGDLDLLVSNAGDLPGPSLPGSIDLLLGNGDGSFQAPVEVLSADASANGIVAADFDRDGKLDFAYASASGAGTGTNGVVVVLGNGDGTFAAPAGYETTADGQPIQLVAADFDGDGVLDLAVANYNDPGSFSVLLGNGNGSFAPPVEIGTFAPAFAIAAGDPDGDGDIDLITGSISGVIEFYNNDLDELSRSAAAAKAITINAVNDAPVLTVQDTTVSGTEDDDLLFNAASSNAITVADVDDATLTVTLTVLNGTLTLSQTTGLAFTTGDGTSDATMLFTGTAADVNAALEGLAYHGGLNYQGADTLSVLVGDGDDSAGEDIAITLADDGTIDGDSGNNVLNGTAGPDKFRLEQGGDDTVNGLGGNDGFYFGAAFTADDTVDGGDGDNDQIGLQGDYTGGNALVLGASTITNIEVIAVLPGGDYDITTVDATVPNGGRLFIFGGNLGSGDNLTFDGSAETTGSFKVYGGLGTDHITTGGGNDAIYFGPNKFDPANDQVNGGTGINDQMALDGDYAITLDGTAIQSIDVIALLKGIPGDLADYSLTLDTSLVGAGQKLTIWGVQLETALTVEGSAVAGDLKLYGGTLGDTLTGGTGDDWLWGGAGADFLTGGDGADTFNYENVAQSRAVGLGFDQIAGFDIGDDKIDLPFAVSSFATSLSGALDAVTMDSSLEGAFAGLTSHQAAVFTATGGDLLGRTFLLIDANGTTGYQATGDFLIELVNPATAIDQLGMFI